MQQADEKGDTMASITIGTEPNNPLIRTFSVAITVKATGIHRGKPLYGRKPELQWISSDVRKELEGKFRLVPREVDGNGNLLRITLVGAYWNKTVEDAVITLIKRHLATSEEVIIVR